MAKLTLKQAAAWCGGQVDEKYENIEFLGASNDTRTLKPGQLFIVLQGARDGHDFIPTAMEQGAAAVLCSRRVGDYPAIYVEDPRLALGRIARAERERIGMQVVGVTGSVGKSTTKEMMALVLSKRYRTAKTPVNHNNDIGMPMAILSMPEDTEVAVLEMGMNHFREMAYLSQVGRPDVAVIVNIGTMHIEHLGTVEGIRRAKLEILEGMEPTGRLLLNGDDPMLCPLPERPVQAVTYFGTGAAHEVRAENVSEGEHITFTVGSQPYRLNLEGRHFVSDALAAVAVGLELGVEPSQIAEALAEFQNMAGRQETFQAEGYTVIKDCYNAGPESMAAALAVLGRKPGRRVAVLGDMLELGDRTQAEHYRIGRIAAANADMVLAYGPNADRVVSGAVTGGMRINMALAFDSQEALARTLKRMARPGDTLLFKGSRGMHMEVALEYFLTEER